MQTQTIAPSEKQRLILAYQSSDGCTWSATNTLPVEYESAEALAVDFELAIKKARADLSSDCVFAGHKFYPGYFFYEDQSKDVYDAPFIGTFDEWFELNSPRG